MDSQNTKNRPKYEMIEEALLERIHAGDFSFDEAFCTEKMLSEQYEVSRIPPSVPSKIWNSRAFCTGNAVSEVLFRGIFRRMTMRRMHRR